MIAIYLMVIIILPVAVGLLVGYRSIPEGRECPICPGKTLRIQARWLTWASRILRSSLHSRWCPGCGWEGVVRIGLTEEQVAPTAPPEAQPRPSRRGAPDYRPPQPSGHSTADRRTGKPRGSREAVDLRNIDIAGEPWRVLLQCWHDTGHWYGRLLFNSPSGRIWPDGDHRFQGDSLKELLHQALALSDHALVARLREVVSD